MILNEDLSYDKERVRTFEELHPETKKVIQWLALEEGQKILEIGCHTGVLSEWLKLSKAKITGVDLNKKALDIASNYLDRPIHADLESDLFWKQLEGETYDSILCLHVLEHLTNPWEFLSRIHSHLTPNGKLIIALPNISNAVNRFNILFGDFDYTKDGVMDQTHLRFFNRKTAEQLINHAKLTVVDYASSYQVNPIHYFLDHLPIFNKFKNIFRKNKLPFCFRKRANITDVVMLFYCKRQE